MRSPTGSSGRTLIHTDLGYHPVVRHVLCLHTLPASVNTPDRLQRTHRQIHSDIRAVQQQDAAGDGGLRRPGRGDVNRRSPGDHGGRVYDLLLMGQEQGVPCHPSCSSSPSFSPQFPVPFVPLSRLEAAPGAAAERPAQKAHHLPNPQDEEVRVASVKTVPHSSRCSRGPASAAAAASSSSSSSPGRGVT